MKFRIGTHEYTLHVTRQPIVMGGKRCEAVAESGGRRILMSDQLPPGRRRNKLLHEIFHCWQFTGAQAADEEGGAELFAMMAEAVTADLERQGGEAALMALPVTDETFDDGTAAAEPDPMPIRGTAGVDGGRPDLENVRRVYHPQLTDDHHWRAVLAMCRRFRLDPADVWVKLDPDEQTGEVKPRLITTLFNLRTIARNTGKFSHEEPPQYCGPDGAWVDVWVQHQPPVAARAVVYRTDSDKPFVGTAYYHRCVRTYTDKAGHERVTRAWEPGSAGPQLGKCAVVAAHRCAFHADVGNLSTREEDDPYGDPPAADKFEVRAAASKVRASGSSGGAGEVYARPETAGAGTAAKPPELFDDPKRAAAMITESTPDTLGRLRLDLMDRCDLGTREADEAIAAYREKLPRTLRADVRAFAAVVMKASGGR